MSTLIGLTGHKGAGKSEVAKYLQEEHGFIRLSFATPLKVAMKILDPIIGVDEDHVPGTKDDYVAYPVHLSDLQGCSEQYIKSNYPEYRRLLQVLGTEVIRGVDDDYFVSAMVSSIFKHVGTDPDVNIVVDDVRFPNEAAVIENALAPYGSGQLWYVSRTGLPVAHDAHSSEAHAGGLGETSIVYNDGALEDLHRDVEKVLARQGLA